jgi:hypothetical protein
MITAKTIRAMASDLDLEQPPAPVLPDGAAYQQIMGVFDHEQRPLRARDLCLRPGAREPSRVPFIRVNRLLFLVRAGGTSRRLTGVDQVLAAPVVDGLITDAERLGDLLDRSPDATWSRALRRNSGG